MREALSDLVRQTASLFDRIKITGSDDETKIQAVGEESILIFSGTLKTPAPELKGEFGIANLPMLSSLLEFASYKAEGATITTKRETKPNVGETVTEFQFRGTDGGVANFKTMGAAQVGQMATVNKIPWDVQVTPNRAKIAEFQQLSSIYSGIGGNVRVFTEDGKLMFSIGGLNDTTHDAKLTFALDVVGEVKTPISFDNGLVLPVLKLIGNNPATFSITSKGVVGIEITTKFGVYNYYIRAKRE